MLGFHGAHVLEGSVRAGETEIAGAPTGVTVRLGLTQVPEGRQIFKNLTVEENLLLGALTRRTKEIGADLEAALEFFPALIPRRRSKTGLLSGGEQQMVALARGLMAKPQVLVIDELTLGLSPKVIEEITERRDGPAATGASLVLVEQNARLALELWQLRLRAGSRTSRDARSRVQFRTDRRIQESYLGVRRGSDGARRMSGGAPGAALAVEGLSLRLGGVVAVDDLSFLVAAR